MNRSGLLAACFGLGLAGPAAAEVLLGVAAPLTGPMAWAGAQAQRGAELALAALNESGGVLGERVVAVVVDDHCDAEQAVAAAHKLVESRVAAVVGHQCSGAAIPASAVYADAGILMISEFATNPMLTERGLDNVFRVIGRDDLQGRIAGDLLADRWPDKRIAIVHDGEAHGRGLAEEARARLAQRGVDPVMFEVIDPRRSDYAGLLQRLERAEVQVRYYGGDMREAGLIVRQAAERGYALQLVAGDGIGFDEKGDVTGYDPFVWYVWKDGDYTPFETIAPSN